MLLFHMNRLILVYLTKLVFTPAIAPAAGLFYRSDVNFIIK